MFQKPMTQRLMSQRTMTQRPHITWSGVALEVESGDPATVASMEG
jgi:hypothetical protein